MSVMKYKDPTTGEVKKIGAPKADTYTKTETDALLQTKANASSVYTKTETDTLLQKKVNPNLLDNWYFGNPVDQRGGYVVPPNTPYYQNDYATQIGTTDKYYTLNIAGYNYGRPYGTIDVNGVIGYIGDAGGAVHGYAGARYGIDRWFLETASGVKFAVELHEDCIRLVQESVTETNRWQAIYQSIGDTAKAITGKVITVSLLHRGTGSTQLYLTKQNTANAFANKIFTNTTNWQVSTFTATVPDDATDVRLRIYADTTGSLGYTDVKAVKLELDSVQTLAHQENGVWVLNEIPNYSEEFLKCIQSTADASDTYANKVIYHTGNKPTPADIGAAPAGYGLGGNAKLLTSADNLDNIKENGWYWWYDTRPSGAEFNYCHMRVDNGQTGSPSSVMQTIYRDSMNTVMIRFNDGNTWITEYVNPPMEIGVEYRTTERYQGKPVYVKVVNCGNSPSKNHKTINTGLDYNVINHRLTPIGNMYSRSYDNFSIPCETTNVVGENLSISHGIYRDSEQVRHDAIFIYTTSTTLTGYTVYVVLKYTKTTD